MKINLNKCTLKLFSRVKIIPLVVLLIFIDFSSSAQILSFYKIQNDAKTAVLPGEVVTFPLDENMSTYENLLVEVNLELLKQTTKYTNVSLAVGFVYDDTSFSRYDQISINFDSEQFKNTYAAEKKLSIYFFKTSALISDPKNKYFFDSNLSVDHNHATRAWTFVLSGAYKTGTESYLSNGVEKQKDVFSAPETITDSQSLVVKFDIPSSAELNRKYELYIQPFGREMGEINGVNLIKTYLYYECLELKSVKKNTSELGEESIYIHIADAITLIEETKRNAILNEPDKQKALDMLYIWNKEYPYLQVLSRSTSAQLLALNGQLNGIKDVNEMLTLFKNFKGR